ncbi:MAG: ADP-ribosylation factor-like protein [Candidatus Heimdallarchaeota archaeon]
MTLLAVRLLDSDNSVVLSTMGFTLESSISEILPFIRSLQAKKSSNQIIINQDKLIAFQSVGSKLLVATATSTMAINKIRKFLAVLSRTVSNISSYEEYRRIGDFEFLCRTVLAVVDAIPRVTIALTGLAQSGKTTFTRFFTNGQPLREFATYRPTRLLEMVEVAEIKEIPFGLRFIDLSSSFQPFWYLFNQISDAFIFFVDCSKRDQMQKAQECFLDLRTFWDKPYCIAANKKDLSTVKDLKRFIARRFQVPTNRVFATETLTGEGIMPLLESLLNSGINTENELVLDLNS